MSRTALTTEYLKERMADALLKLMQTCPVDKISVQSITAAAGVGRVTWFRNFSSKNEALTYKVIRLWRRWAEEHGLADLSHYSRRHALDFFQFNNSIRGIHAALYDANLQSILYDAFYQIMMPQHGADVEDSYKSRFYSYGLFGLLDEWIKRDYRETPEEMTSIFLRTASLA